MKRGYVLPSWAYGFERDQELIVRAGSSCWLMKRSPKVSKAAAQWIDEIQFPLGDVALNTCPSAWPRPFSTPSGPGPAPKPTRLVSGQMKWCGPT